jgi:hypothetical protein
MVRDTVAHVGEIPMTVVKIAVRCELIEANIETKRALMRAVGSPGGGEIEVAFSDFVGASDGDQLSDEFGKIIMAACPTMTMFSALALVDKLVARVVM